MYICGLILFCMMFIYDFSGFDFLVFLMKRMSDLNACVVDF